MATTTLNKIKSIDHYKSLWQKIVVGLNKTEASNEDLELTFIFEKNRQKDLFLLLEEINKPLLVRFYADCAERILDIFEKECPKDSRPKKAIEAARNWADNPTEKNKEIAKYTYAAAAASTAACGYASTAAYIAALAAYSAAYPISVAYPITSPSDYALFIFPSTEKDWQKKHLLKLLTQSPCC